MRRKKFKQRVGFFILACIFVVPFHHHVAEFALSFLPNQNVTITVVGSTDGKAAPVTIYYEGQSNELFLQMKEEAEGKNDWTFHEGERGVSWTWLSSSVIGAKLTIYTQPSIDSYLCFESNGRNGQVQIAVGGKQEIINTHTESLSTVLLRVHPFARHISIILIDALTWLLLISGTYVVLFLFSKLIARYPHSRYIFVAFMAIGYLLYYSVSTSPLYPNRYGGDSAFFILVGKGMKYGLLPYRDFYDMKGPWLFVLEWLGQVASEGRFGAFLLQCVNMVGAMIMFDKLIGIGRGKCEIAEICLLSPLFLTAIFSIGGGNLTEELSLFPLSVVLYFGMRYLIRDEDEHKPFHAGIYGSMFGILTLIRISNAALICAVVLTIFIVLIVKKKWINLAKNAGAFVAGFLIAVLPMIIFFAAHGLFSEMFDQVFVYGFKYTDHTRNVGMVRMFTGVYKESLYPIYVCLFASLLFFRKKRWKITLLIWLSTMATFVSIALSGRNFEHYYGLLIPVVALDVWFVWEAIHENGWRRIAAVACGVIFAVSYRGTYLLDQTYVNKNILVESNINSEMSIVDVAAHISDDGSVYCWTAQPRWYMYADKFPSCRYCGWQKDQMAIDPTIGKELADMFLKAPPQWLVLENNNNDIPDFVFESRNQYYKEVYKNKNWILYFRK